MWWQLDRMQPGKWPDPARADYAVWGNSDSFILNARNFGRFVPLGQERVGDIACYVGGVGHAELVVARGRVLTNGSEAGPYYRPIAHHSGKVYIRHHRILKYLPNTEGLRSLTDKLQARLRTVAPMAEDPDDFDGDIPF